MSHKRLKFCPVAPILMYGADIYVSIKPNVQPCCIVKPYDPLFISIFKISDQNMSIILWQLGCPCSIYLRIHT